MSKDDGLTFNTENTTEVMRITPDGFWWNTAKRPWILIWPLDHHAHPHHPLHHLWHIEAGAALNGGDAEERTDGTD